MKQIPYNQDMEAAIDENAHAERGLIETPSRFAELPNAAPYTGREETRGIQPVIAGTSREFGVQLPARSTTFPCDPLLPGSHVQAWKRLARTPLATSAKGSGRVEHRLLSIFSRLGRAAANTARKDAR